MTDFVWLRQNDGFYLSALRSEGRHLMRARVHGFILIFPSLRKKRNLHCRTEGVCKACLHPEPPRQSRPAFSQLKGNLEL
jgi:hypothetical protein